MQYHTTDKPVLDPCSGSRMFWFDKTNPIAVFGDIRNEKHVLCDGRELNISPDIIMDFRDIPFADNSFRLIVFDPPHLKGAGQKGWQGLKYGVLDASTWKHDIEAGFRECFRVLADDGVLIFKWNENSIKVKELLALSQYNPLFGHKSGAQQKTHWIAFIKNKTMLKIYDGV